MFVRPRVCPVITQSRRSEIIKHLFDKDKFQQIGVEKTKISNNYVMVIKDPNRLLYSDGNPYPLPEISCITISKIDHQNFSIILNEKYFNNNPRRRFFQNRPPHDKVYINTPSFWNNHFDFFEVSELKPTRPIETRPNEKLSEMIKIYDDPIPIPIPVYGGKKYKKTKSIRKNYGGRKTKRNRNKYRRYK